MAKHIFFLLAIIALLAFGEEGSAWFVLIIWFITDLFKAPPQFRKRESEFSRSLYPGFALRFEVGPTTDICYLYREFTRYYGHVPPNDFVELMFHNFGDETYYPLQVIKPLP